MSQRGGRTCGLPPDAEGPLGQKLTPPRAVLRKGGGRGSQVDFEFIFSKLNATLISNDPKKTEEVPQVQSFVLLI